MWAAVRLSGSLRVRTLLIRIEGERRDQEILNRGDRE